jgi:hypothetical protein
MTEVTVSIFMPLSSIVSAGSWSGCCVRSALDNLCGMTASAIINRDRVDCYGMVAAGTMADEVNSKGRRILLKSKGLPLADLTITDFIVVEGSHDVIGNFYL